MSDVGLRNKQTVLNFWGQLDKADLDQAKQLFMAAFDPETSWHGPHPINDLKGADQVYMGYWAPLKVAVPDIVRRIDLLFAGDYNDKRWVTASGYFTGTFAGDWLGIPTAGRHARIRFGEFCALQDGKITATYLILDLLEVMMGLGYRVLPPEYSGVAGQVPGPATADGVILNGADPQESRASLELTEAMLTGLAKYDQSGQLQSMGQARYWQPDMMWYGPVGIGTTNGFKGFEDHHQRPFLKAFPDRKGGHHQARFAEGMYSASTGWPSLYATHLGEYLGVPATGKRVGMRVMDWWRREGDKLAENWVLIDMIDAFLQMDEDLFDRLQVQTEER